MRRSTWFREAGSIAAAVVAVFAQAACSDAGDGDETEMAEAAEAPSTLPDTVRVSSAGLHPEGIEYDAERGRFLITSVTRGEITVVEDDGSSRVLVAEAPTPSAIGVHVDQERDRFYVAHSSVQAIQDSTFDGPGRLGAYDLETGEAIWMADLAPLHDGRRFANDMAVGPDGAVYVTNSLSPVIYRVTADGQASVFLEDDRMGSGFILNGVEVHPDGYLLVAGIPQRTVLKIPLDDPAAWTPVEIPEDFAADGLTLRDDGALIAVATTFPEGGPPASEVLVLESGDDWATAAISARGAAPDDATTAVIRDGEIYIVDARFADMGADTPAPTFDLVRIEVR